VVQRDGIWSNRNSTGCMYYLGAESTISENSGPIGQNCRKLRKCTSKACGTDQVASWPGPFENGSAMGSLLSCRVKRRSTRARR